MVEAMGVEERTVSAAHVGRIPSGPAVEAKQSADLGTGDEEELLAALRLCEMVEAMGVEERTVSAAHVGRIPSGPAVEAKQSADLGTGDEELLAALRLCEMGIVCEVCGVTGYRQVLVQCRNCKNAARHLYCFDPIVYDASSFEWLCGDCPPNHNEVPKSLEWNCDRSHKIPRWKGSRNVIEEHNMLFEKGFDKAGVRMFSRPENMNDVLETRSVTSFHVPDDSSCDDHNSIQLGSMVNEPNVNRIEVTKEPLSWGCRRHRSHKARCTWGCRRRRSQKARRENSDASTKHFLSADTFNSSEMFDVKKLKCDDILEEAESKNDLNDVEKSNPFAMDSSFPTVPNMEQKVVLEKNAEQPHPSEMVNPDGTSHSPVGPALQIQEQGAEAGLCASVEDVKGQVDGSSPASESWEQPVPLKVVILRPWHDVPNSILRSSYSQSMQGSDLHVGNMLVLDPSKEWLDSRLKLEQGLEPGLFASAEYVEQTHPSFTDKTSPIWSSEEHLDGSSPTSESWEQPDPLEVVRPWDDAPNSILRMKLLSNYSQPMHSSEEHLDGSSPTSERWEQPDPLEVVRPWDDAPNSILRMKLPSKYSQPMQGSDLDVGNMDALDPSKEWMDSRLLSNTVEPSSSSNGGSTSVEKDNTEKTECLSGMDTITPGLHNVEGSNPLVEPSSSSNGDGNSAVEKHSAEMTECLLGTGTLTPALHNVQALNLPTPKKCLVSNAGNTDEANRSDEVHCSHNDLKSVRPFENVMAEKRERPILSYDEDAEVSRPVKSSLMKQRRSTENSEEAMSTGNSNNQHASDHMKARKQRSASKDKKTSLGNASVPCTQNDAARLASDQQSSICTHPIDRPFWTGIMKIGQEYISLDAHLSNQACKEVQELSLSLPALMKVTKHSKLKAWPGRWKASEPTAKCIGLYFFSDNMRELDQLVHYLTDHNLLLKYVVGFAKLLIFPSVFLPEQCQKFQGKHYLWGVFKRRMQVPQRDKRGIN